MRARRRRVGGPSLLPEFRADLTSDLNPQRARGDDTATITRATAAWFYNQDTGLVEAVSSGEARHDSRGILIEGARTNLCAYSHDLTGTGWVSATLGAASAPVVTANFATDPRGVATSASRLQCDLGGGTTTGDRSWREYNLSGLSNPHDVVNTLWLQSNSGTPVVEISCAAGAVTERVTVTSTWTPFTISATGVAGTTDRISVGLIGGRTPACSDTCDINVAFAQIEIGATFSSSPIFTNGTAVPRNADVLTYSAVGQADSFPMTIVAEYTPTQVGTAAYIASIDDQSSDNRIELAVTSGAKAYLNVVDGGVNQGTPTGTTSLVAGTTYTVAGVVAVNDLGFYLNGASEGTPDTSATMPTVDTIHIGATNAGTQQPYGFIRNVRIYPRRLTDGQIAAL